MALAVKLLALIALVLMPLGMAPAAATPAQHAAMPMEHCPDPSPKQAHSGIAGCTMACAGALPAILSAEAAPLLPVEAPAEASPTAQLHGLHPETATPPPRNS
jgi:hypothetical protein